MYRIISEFCNSNVNFCKVVGLIACFHGELTDYSVYNLQFDLNGTDFDELIELVISCLKTSSSQDPNDWTFFTNCK